MKSWASTAENAKLRDPAWFGQARDHCQAVGVLFFFKQLGEWLQTDQRSAPGETLTKNPWPHPISGLIEVVFALASARKPSAPCWTGASDGRCRRWTVPDWLKSCLATC